MVPDYLDDTTGWALKSFQAGRDQIFAGSLLQFVNRSVGPMK